MSTTIPLCFRNANEYADHVDHYLLCDATPMPPITPDELAVILFEHPQLIVEYLELLLRDTPTRQAALGFLAEVSDGDESASQL